MDIRTHAKLGRHKDMRLPEPVDPNSLLGRLIELSKHLERLGSISPTDVHLIQTIIHHPEMPEHLRKEESRPSYEMSEGYEGPVGKYLG